MVYEKKMIKTIVYMSLFSSAILVIVLAILDLYHKDGVNTYLLLVTAITSVTGCIGKVEKYDTFLEVISIYSDIILYIIVIYEACSGGTMLSDQENLIILILTFAFATLSVYVSLCEMWNNEIIMIESNIKNKCKNIMRWTR